MFERQTSGSVVCPSCHKLVGVQEARCWNCGRPYPGMWGFTPLLRRLGQDLGFVQVVIGGSLVLYALTLMADPQGIRTDSLWNFMAPAYDSLRAFGASGGLPVLVEGRWWTLLSAGWLHGSLIHIGFNLYWVTRFAPEVAELYGAGRMVILYTLGSVTGFLFSTFAVFPVYVFPPLGWILGSGAGITVGASAALFGLLGALVHYGRRVSPAVGRQALVYVAFFLIFGLLVRSVDNWAHLGGFVGGYLGSRIMDPMKPERGDHLLWALLCLVATAAAVVASLLVPIAQLR